MRAGLVLAGAIGFCFALSHAASADTVKPTTAYQPSSRAILEMAKTGSPAGMLPQAQLAQPESAPAAAAEARGQAAPATPAPEPQVKPVPAHLARPVALHSDSALAKVLQPFRAGVGQIGSFFGRVVSACQVASGGGAGVPVLVLGVLSMAVAFDRRRILGIWSATDEDAPELLYATEVIKPG